MKGRIKELHTLHGRDGRAPKLSSVTLSVVETHSCLSPSTGSTTPRDDYLLGSQGAQGVHRSPLDGNGSSVL